MAQSYLDRLKNGLAYRSDLRLQCACIQIFSTRDMLRYPMLGEVIERLRCGGCKQRPRRVEVPVEPVKCTFLEMVRR